MALLNESNDSVCSYTEDQLNESPDLDFSKAPYDIIEYHPEIGNKVIVKAGTELPMTTKFFKRKTGTKAVRFSVDRSLDVKVIEERDIQISNKENNNSKETSLNKTGSPGSLKKT